MNTLYIGTALFAASLLSFGLAFYVMRTPRGARWGEQEVLLSLICVAITSMIVLTAGIYSAAAFDWKNTLADFGLPMLAGFAVVDLLAIFAASVLVAGGRRAGTVTLQTSLGQIPVGVLPIPANSPTSPSGRVAA